MTNRNDHELPEITRAFGTASGAGTRAASRPGSLLRPVPTAGPGTPQRTAGAPDKSRLRAQHSLRKLELIPSCCTCVNQPSLHRAATWHFQVSIGASLHQLPFIKNAVISRARGDKNKSRDEATCLKSNRKSGEEGEAGPGFPASHSCALATSTLHLPLK